MQKYDDKKCIRTCGGGCGTLTAELLTFRFNSCPLLISTPFILVDNKSTHLFASDGP